MWRAKLGAFCELLNLTPDNYRVLMKECFGRNWVHHLRPLIESIKLPEFNTDEDARHSLRSAWVVAVSERERLCNGKRQHVQATGKPLVVQREDLCPVEPVPAWASWIERTIKAD